MPAIRRSERLQALQSSAKAAHSTRSPQPTAQTLRGPFDDPKPRIARQPISKGQTYLTRPSSTVLRDPNHSTPLFHIPREVLYIITTHLPPAGLACLTLTCKLGLEIIGMDSWAEFRGRARFQHAAEGSLCMLLVRDLPGHEYCVRCERVHSPRRPPQEHRVDKFSQSCFGSETTRAFEERQPDALTSEPLDLLVRDDRIHVGMAKYTRRPLDRAGSRLPPGIPHIKDAGHTAGS
ncbi:hypothetical protein BJY00DRAFT_316391 [Aspergillus carlsbadensis]|nr:hypothetical protein BJY00DRAFT_316391 [Aspergillus carlsbadensis]